MRPPQTAHHANRPRPRLQDPHLSKCYCLLLNSPHFHETNHSMNVDNTLLLKELSAKHRRRD